MTDAHGLDKIKELREELIIFFGEHNRFHAISNAPYGHECGKRCVSESLALWFTRKQEVKINEIAVEVLTNALHPEFGTEWQPPMPDGKGGMTSGGTCWRAYHDGILEGERSSRG